ncbi:MULTISPECIES: transcription-repair coupling factor [unclassified Pseudonocardia]|uniref:transcription-repair coupling factor n=1 Tax=unclassified Pseudonocardia TaxID=2619320 RepID=UPI00095B5420|nr:MULTISPECIES: transcription-repair coupling factor [unclassified Pseudonocardia]MBN9101842.1 transcription-repair coupling factor [Pseudonocardia sp.]OJY45032.1 MAG: transcription-repair coupling factor [Pseudonocardia sp. 73-21]
MIVAKLSGLLRSTLSDPELGAVVDAARDLRPVETPALRIEGPAALRPFLSAGLADGRTVLAVTATDREAEDLSAAAAELIGADAVAVLPSWETLPHERLSPRPDTVGRRLSIFRSLASAATAPRVLVSAARSLIQPIAPGLGSLDPVRLRVGDTHDFDALLERLVELAYTRVEMVTARGEFAVRGGIVDVFAPTADQPVRVEFWGDEVSELRSFSVADQRSVAPIEELLAPGCRELLLTEPVRARAAALARTHENNPPLRELLDHLSQGIPAEGMESLIPVLVGGELQLLSDLLPPNALVLIADPERIRTRSGDLVRTGQEFLEASWFAASSGADAPIDVGSSAYRSLGEVLEHATATGHPVVTLSPLLSGRDDVLAPAVHEVESYRGDTDRALTDLRAHVATGGTGVLVVGGSGTAQRSLEQLKEAEVPAALVEELTDEPEKGLVTVTCGRIAEGFTAGRLVVLSEADLTGNRAGLTETRKMPTRRKNTVDLVTLKPGDHVVHSQHGIGKFVEMKERTVSGATREYLVLEYASSKRGQPADRLFVPTDALDEISRYVGGELPTLNKLGGGDWAKTKGRARKAVRQIAAQLVQLYAARQSAPGHAFAKDTPWQREMEDAFPYTETPDQLSAIDEVKADMERPVPMDRVISGDVGFGKTEIAVRAAFKAVQDGKQVVVLVPTTLLATQHLDTFTERMRAFPVTVRGLSRFTDAAEARETVAGLADGTVDVVVGTHRLLQSNIRWKDLGLVIVDEEQRFGVEHKEHITALRTHVDVLTLSATPIPRTLEMSLAGIRELSTITTPPEDRHPTLTYVGAYDDKQVAAAIRRELLRDGQVFYVHNRVSTIDRAAGRIRALVPEARVAIAHGQMNEDLLERTVNGFWHNEFDVLVCTTIVENGLDISNANTLIVERSDTLGLSQLHQLRGRVGRGRERGYAYFLFPPEHPLTETAHDRLATIAQHSELGAGAAVAMKDLEIRGAGNILGAEQSGHIAGVGFDLYIRLVGEAVAAFRQQAGAGEGETEEQLTDVRVDLPIDAHVPHDYVTGERLRLEVYRKIAEAGDEAALTAIVEELGDRYGEPPAPVHNLLAVARFRQTCRALGVAEVTVAGNGIRLGPLELPDSAQMRLKRLHPKSSYKPAARVVLVPKPVEGGRIGGAELRDVALLDWCTKLLRDLLTPVRAPAAV